MRTHSLLLANPRAHTRGRTHGCMDSQVRMVCDGEEAVVAAEEVQRCLYDLTLSTPAACQARRARA